MTNPKAIFIGQEKCLYFSAEQCQQLALNLALAINQKIASSNIKKPELIIGIAKGSLAWLRTLSDWLNIDALATLRVVHYNGIGQRLPQPTILQSHLPRIDKKRVLLFDNIADTGKTLSLTVNYLKMCGAQTITTAVLFYKKCASLIPDFYASQTDAWIIFYFEIVETVKLLGSKWLNEGLTLKEINKRFLAINIPAKEVTEAMKIIFNF